MKLFGLVESLHIDFILDYRPIQIRHDELYRKLDQLTQNNSSLSIGLEPSSDKKELRIPPLTFIQQEIYLDLIKFFRKRGNKIFFLEQENDQAEMAKIAKQKIDLEKKIEQQNNEANKKSLTIEVDRLAIGAVYLSMLGKERGILQNIAQYKPDIVLLGAAHASRFYKNRAELASKLGIEIEEYWQEEANILSQDEILRAMSCSNEHISTEDYLDGKSIAALKLITSSEMALDDKFCTHLERLHKAVKEEKVTDGNPSAIGTWDLELEHRGLFEMYIEKAEGVSIRGTIEDTLGSASFTGAICQDHIQFTKIYTKDFGPGVDLLIPIVYEGTLRNGEFIGKFTPSYGRSGFRMKKPFIK